MTNIAGDKLHIGIKGIQGETPKLAKLIYRGLMAALFVWSAAKMQFPEIPPHVADVVTRILDFGTPLIYGVSQFFGWAKPDGE